MRSWTCFNYNTQHDPDVNAAINIRDEGLRLLALGTSATVSEGNIGPRVRRKSPGSKAVTLKLEARTVLQARLVPGKLMCQLVCMFRSQGCRGERVCNLMRRLA